MMQIVSNMRIATLEVHSFRWQSVYTAAILSAFHMWDIFDTQILLGNMLYVSIGQILFKTFFCWNV
jgi:hypothetical protein